MVERQLQCVVQPAPRPGGPRVPGTVHNLLVDGDGAWTLKASVYINLNPIRTARFGLAKAAHKGETKGWVVPGAAEIKARLRALREFRWSSFGAQAGYGPTPEWLQTEELLSRIGGQAKYRRQVLEGVTRGAAPEGYEDLRGRLALWSREFLEKAKSLVGVVTKEQPARRELKTQTIVEHFPPAKQAGNAQLSFGF